MKRFTETTKWRDPWFRNLSPQAKLLWLWLLDHCDRIGIVEVELAAASFDLGDRIKEKHLAELVSRLQATETSGRYFVSKFIPFQYGRLSETCPAHRPVIEAVHAAHLTITPVGYQYPIDTLPLGLQIPSPRVQEKEKETEEDKEKDKDPSKQIPPSLEAIKEYAAAQGLPEEEAIKFHGYYTSNGWRVGKNPMKSWHGAIATWRGNWREQNGHTRATAVAAPLWQQIKAIEEQIAGVDKQLMAIPSRPQSVYPKEFAMDEAKRQPLRERKAKLKQQLGELKAKQAGGE